MARVEGAIEVERPLAAVYRQLLQQPDVRITERVPDEAVAWQRGEDASEAWRASLIALSPKRTRVDLAVDHDPSNLVERAADAFGGLERRLQEDLGRLKEHVESTTPRPD